MNTGDRKMTEKNEGNYIIAATKNKHKIEEINAITAKFGMNIIPQDEAGFANIDVVEDGETFEENSFKKADAIMKASGKITIADDSGLMVDALGGAPGVYSARFCGVEHDDKGNNEKLLKLLDGIPVEKRTAKFVTVITMLFPDGEKIVARGECPGRIATETAGSEGFGYDPLFIPDGYDCQFAVLGQDVKNSISHRARALQELERILSCR